MPKFIRTVTELIESRGLEIDGLYRLANFFLCFEGCCFFFSYFLFIISKEIFLTNVSYVEIKVLEVLLIVCPVLELAETYLLCSEFDVKWIKVRYFYCLIFKHMNTIFVIYKC